MTLTPNYFREFLLDQLDPLEGHLFWTSLVPEAPLLERLTRASHAERRAELDSLPTRKLWSAYVALETDGVMV